MAGKLLRVYVQDHHAAAAAGLNLVRRLARENASTPFADELTRLADEIADDRAKLAAVLRASDVKPSRLKIGLARAAERASRLKLNGRLISYSPLSRVIELETLGGGILAKRGLWNALARTTGAQKAGLDSTNWLSARTHNWRSWNSCESERPRSRFRPRGTERRLLDAVLI